VICTEYMARPVGSTFDTVLPIAKEETSRRRDQLGIRRRQDADVFAVGVVGASVRSKQPPVWFHEVLRPDGNTVPAGRGGFDPAANREAVGIRNHGGLRSK